MLLVVGGWGVWLGGVVGGCGWGVWLGLLFGLAGGWFGFLFGWVFFSER